jgi:hypothetical protein
MLHEYLRDTMELRYSECKSCRNRTQFACIECGFCYSCHWRNEKLEKKIQFKPLAIAKSTFLKNYSQPVTATLAKIEEHSRRQPTQQQQQLTKVIDVFGRETEPICSYHTCHHKFSLHRHSTRACKCNHPQNHIVGVSVL